MTQPRTRRDRGRRRRTAAVVSALSVAALALVPGCAAGTDPASDHSPERADPTLEHVHGLGVDPADGSLYAGTHHGLFRLRKQGGTTLVAGRVQDLMGFTVAGPRHFLASGHPGPGQDGPPALGLIQSTDGGRTWDSLSLSGEADFHALAYRHDRVYGLDARSGTFMVSADKADWETRSTLPMADFAVSPTDPDVVLATTERGLLHSDDGGRSFGPVPGAPVLLLVDWDADGRLVGVGPDGSVHVSSGPGRLWATRGRVDGAPEALATQGSAIYLAVAGAVTVSTDGGRTFTAL